MRYEVRAVTIMSILLLLVGCAGEEQATERTAVVRPVKVLSVGAGLAGDSQVSFPGRVAAGTQVDLAFRVGGPLIELPVQEGEKVAKGQVVGVIDPRDYLIRIDSAQAQFDKAEADIERMSALYERDAASKAQLDQVRAARGVAKAALDDANANLSDTRLRAPFAAQVGEKFVSNFEDVQAKQPILSLVAVDTIKIEVNLPESIVAKLRERTKTAVFAQFAAAPGREFPLKMSELAAQADARTQTYQATLTMPQPAGVNILPGMTAIVRASEDAGLVETPIVVPAVAVAGDDSGAAHVWVVDQDAMTVHKRDVTTGNLVGTDGIRIVNGLADGEMIAVSAVSRLREGMAVRKLGE